MMVQPYDYRHLNGNSGLSMLVPLTLSQAQSFGGNNFFQTMSQNRTAFRPFFVGDLGLTITKLGVYWAYLLNASNNRYGLAIYDNAPPEELSVYPRNLLQSFGQTAVTSVTNTSPGEFAWTPTLSTPLVLAPGLYWTLARLPAGVNGNYRAHAEVNNGRQHGPWLTGDAVGLYTDSALFGTPAVVPNGSLTLFETSTESGNPVIFAE